MDEKRWEIGAKGWKHARHHLDNLRKTVGWCGRLMGMTPSPVMRGVRESVPTFRPARQGEFPVLRQTKHPRIWSIQTEGKKEQQNRYIDI